MIDKLKNIKGIGLIIIGIIAGIVLIIIGNIDFTPTVEIVAKPEVNYIDQLEEKITQLLESIDGVTSVNVMLTLESGSEYIYAQDRNGEVRDYVIISEADKSESPILVKEVNPQIRGIAVVCRGGNNSAVQSQIINLLSTLFNLPSNRIFVTG